MKKRRKDKVITVEKDLIADDDGDDSDDGEDDEDVVIPLENMTKWLENKPRGFGEGKVYDTSIEDKLFVEIEQSEEAQLANINKLKNNPVQPTSKKDNHQVPEVIPSGVRVRLLSLPKKKNVHRDLQAAFKGVPSIINITPAVSGNKKTREPVCKGFAFVDLKSEDDANRFIQIFSTQSITFGKIQKKIKCELTNSFSPNSVQQSAHTTPQLRIPVLEEDPAADFDMVDSSWEETASDESDGPDDDEIKLEDTSDNLESIVVTKVNGSENMEPTTDVTPVRRRKVEVFEKKPVKREKLKKRNEVHEEIQMVEKITVKRDGLESEDMSENLEPIIVTQLNGSEGMEPTTESATVEEEEEEEIIQVVLKKSIRKGKPKERIEALEGILLSRSKTEEVSKPSVSESSMEKIQASENKTKTEKVPNSSISGSEKKSVAREKTEKLSKFSISGSSDQPQKGKKKEKKVDVRKKGDKVSSIPGASNRLRIKEKAVLTGVFNKYGVKSALAVREES